VPKPAARIIRQPQVRSGHVNLVTSEKDGIHHRTVSRRAGPLFKDAKAAAWGDTLGPDSKEAAGRRPS
jgi:ribosomal protein RSM22 (predicted rRNA methylase)